MKGRENDLRIREGSVVKVKYDFVPRIDQVIINSIEGEYLKVGIPTLKGDRVVRTRNVIEVVYY